MIIHTRKNDEWERKFSYASHECVGEISFSNTGTLKHAVKWAPLIIKKDKDTKQAPLILHKEN